VEAANTHHGATGCAVSTTTDTEDDRTERGIGGKSGICGGAYTARITAASIIAAEEAIFGTSVKGALIDGTTRLTDREFFTILEVNVSAELTIAKSLLGFSLPCGPIKGCNWI
jgi:hypothetical protein